MGIKFHCPNGHRLNVKAFLAGKKGVCPKCGAKMRIPTASEPALVDSDVEEDDSDASQHPVKSNGSGAVAAPKHQNGAGAYGASPVPAPVLRCVHGTWDPNGVRCDGLDD